MKLESSITIGNVRFSVAASALSVRGKPLALYTESSTPTLSFSAAQVAALPSLSTAPRVEVFVADGQKPMLAIFPCGAGEGTAFLNDGKSNLSPRRKIQGRTLERLAPYARVEFRVEEIDSPRSGWLLTPTASERKA